MAEVIIGITVKRAAPEADRRYQEMRARLYGLGWSDVMGPRGPEPGLYINEASLNSVARVIAYLKGLGDEAGKPLLQPGDKVSLRVLGPQGGKAHYVVPER